MAKVLKNLFISILLASLLAGRPVFAHDGGASNGGGGGGGVICFKDEAAARRAKRSDGSIRTEMIDQIYWASILDLYPLSLHEHAIENETPLGYLYRVLESRWRPISSVLVDKIETALKRVDPSLWKSVSSLPYLADYSENVRDLGVWYDVLHRSYCTLAQFVLRYQRQDSSSARPVVIIANKALINKLGVAFGKRTAARQIEHEAALILHEAIYILGRDLGQFNSEDTRAFVMFLLADPSISRPKAFGQQTQDEALLKSRLQLAQVLYHTNLQNVLMLYNQTTPLQKSYLSGQRKVFKASGDTWKEWRDDFGQFKFSPVLTFGKNQERFTSAADFYDWNRSVNAVVAELTDEEAFAVNLISLQIDHAIVRDSTNTLINTSELLETQSPAGIRAVCNWMRLSASSARLAQPAAIRYCDQHGF